MVGIQPSHERATGVQRDRQILISLEYVQEGQVAVAVRLLEDIFEIADWLMVVQQQDESNVMRRGRKSGPRGRCLDSTLIGMTDTG